MTRRVWSPRLAGVGIVVFMAVSLAGLSAGQPRGVVSIDDDDIGGVVTGPNGPEAGVWVIAETTALPTRFSKVVVTDDNGRYLIPDLPDATYDVWVRGYGLVDSSKAHATPGTTLNLTAVVAPTPQAAARHALGNKATTRFPRVLKMEVTGMFVVKPKKLDTPLPANVCMNPFDSETVIEPALGPLQFEKFEAQVLATLKLAAVTGLSVMPNPIPALAALSNNVAGARLLGKWQQPLKRSSITNRAPAGLLKFTDPTVRLEPKPVTPPFGARPEKSMLVVVQAAWNDAKSV